MRIAAIVEYLGTNYCGFQIQPNVKTIQQYLEAALSEVANHNVKIEAAGRTDAGVHALGQVFHFDTTSVRANHSWIKGVNSLLPKDIVIKWASQASDDFHARFCAVRREYQYLLYCSQSRSAIWDKHCGLYPYYINMDALDSILSKFIGTHDFSSFRSSECQSKKPIKEIYEIGYSKKDNFLIFKFVADGFLHHQIRNMMSVILDIANEKREINYIDYLFDVKDRSKASNTFSPNGLYLTNIVYDESFNIPTLNNKILA